MRKDLEKKKKQVNALTYQVIEGKKKSMLKIFMLSNIVFSNIKLINLTSKLTKCPNIQKPKYKLQQKNCECVQFSKLCISTTLQFQLCRPVQFSSVTQSCRALCDIIDLMTGFSVHHQLLELAQLVSVESVMPFNHFIFCHSLLLLTSIFPSIGVFFNESVL